jgi:hypothetical protein
MPNPSWGTSQWHNIWNLKKKKKRNTESEVSFFWAIFCIFSTWKIRFPHTFKGFFLWKKKIKKLAHIHQISKNKNLESPQFYNYRFQTSIK